MAALYLSSAVRREMLEGFGVEASNSHVFVYIGRTFANHVGHIYIYVYLFRLPLASSCKPDAKLGNKSI